LNHFNIFILKKDILGREYSVDEVLDDKIENGISKYYTFDMNTNNRESTRNTVRFIILNVKRFI